MKKANISLSILLIGIALANLAPGKATLSILVAIISTGFLSGIYISRYQLSLDRTFGLIIFSVLLLLIIHAVLARSMSMFLRVIIFGPVAASIIAIIPTIFSPRDVAVSICVSAGLITLVEFPSLLLGSAGGSLELGNLTVHPIGYLIIGNANGYGFFAASGAVGGLSLSTRGTQNIKLLALICSIGTILSLSRGALLAMCAGLVVVILHRYVSEKSASIIPILGALGGLVLMAIGIGLFPSLGISLSNRGVLWGVSIDTIAQRPIFGWGYVDTGLLLTDYVPNNISGKSPHNGFLQIGILGGIIGLSLYLWLFASAIRNAMYRLFGERGSPIPLALITTVFIIHFVEAITIFGISLTAVIAGLILSICQNASYCSIESAKGDEIVSL